MICALQSLLKPDAALPQVIAETPSCPWPLSVEFPRKIKVVMWRVPVEPKSTSASSPPNTVLPGCCSAASMMPWKVGFEPKGPVHRLVPNCMSDASPKLSPTIPIVPFAAIEISGSLLPSGRESGVLVNIRLPIDVLPNVTNTANTETPKITPSHLIVLPLNLGFILNQSQ